MRGAHHVLTGNEGPCVDSFKDAFSCWFFSESEEKGEECVEKFFNMSDCMKTNTVRVGTHDWT